MTQTSEKLLDADLSIDRASCCWTFFDLSVSYTSTLHLQEPAGQSLALTKCLSRMFSGLSDFLMSTRGLNEVWEFYRIVTSLIFDIREQNCKKWATFSRPSSAVDCAGRIHARGTGKNCPRICSYGFLLTFAFLLNSVLSAHHPNSSDLIIFRQEHSSQVLSLSMQAEQLKPIGAGLVALYLEVVWAANAENIGLKMTTTGNTHKAAATARWSVGVCRKLELVLQPLLGYLPLE